MVNVLVLGASGFIGEPLSLMLRKRGHAVYGWVRNAERAQELVKGEVSLVVGDVGKPESFELFADAVKKADVIVNTTLDYTNVHLDQQFFEAFSSVVEKSSGNKKKLIFLSGMLAHEPSAEALTEESPYFSEASLKELSTTDPLFENMIRNRTGVERKVCAAKSFSGIVARAPMVYGGVKSRWTIIFKRAEEGKLALFGGGDSYIGYMHLHDFVDGLVKLVEADAKTVENQAFDFGEDVGGRLSQRDVAIALARGVGKEPSQLEEVVEPFPFAVYGRGNYWVDPSKARRVLGWKPAYNLARDAKLLYDSWKAYGTPGQW